MPLIFGVFLQVLDSDHDACRCCDLVDFLLLASEYVERDFIEQERNAIRL